MGDDQEESQVEALSRDLERLAIKTLIVLCTSFPRPRRKHSRAPMAASAKPPVHNTTDQQITSGKEKSLNCNGLQMSVVLGLSALL